MGQLRAIVDLPASSSAPALARRVTGAILAGWGLDATISTAELVVTELVTNALEHAPGSDSYELEIVRQGDGARIYLADGSSVRPTIQELSQERPRGYGMRIVDAFGSRWGSDEHNGGKRVWVDVDADADGNAPDVPTG